MLKMREKSMPQQQQTFVRVSFDFGYEAEDGKKVSMRENEVLLLINRTNHDWWQVIRRGDRRPFYAPAKYVVELRPEEVDTLRRKQTVAQLGPVLKDARHVPGPMTTFSAAQVPGKLFNHKRPAGPRVGPPHPELGLAGSTKFNERYRSNSLDSILLSDVANLQPIPRGPLTNRNSVFELKTGPQYIKKNPPPQKGLEKRPTFEALDKRKSWSVDAKSMESLSTTNPRSYRAKNQPQSSSSSLSKGRISAYQNAQALFGSTLPSNPPSMDTTAEKRKKPIPLPRSKLPQVPSRDKGSKISEPKSSLHARFFSKRSKTDLGSDGLAAYKQKKPTSQGSKYLPSSNKTNKPVPQKRSESTFAIYEHPELVESDRLHPTSHTINLSQSSGKKDHIRPEAKKKPLFSTFKSQLSDQTFSAPREKKRMSKTVSESDLIQSLRLEEERALASVHDVNKIVAHVTSVEPISISVNSDSSSSKSNNAEGSDAEGQFIKHSVASNDNKLVIDTSKTVEKGDKTMGTPSRAKLERIDSDEDEDVVAVPPPKSFGKSQPLQITTQPLVDRFDDSTVDAMSEDAEKSCSTSFESNDDSLMGELVSKETFDSSGMMDSSGESLELRTKSPTVSTMSRSPPSPEPNGLSPIRQHVVPDWDEYEDNQSKRRFYYNRVTKEKTWKPPRKQRSDVSIPSQSGSPILDEVVIDETVVSEERDLDVLNGTSHKEVPNGYEYRTDVDSGTSFYVNVFTGVRWFTAKDSEGKDYFYEENGNESCWRLPNVSQSIQDNDFVHSIRRSERVKQPLTGSTRRMTENFRSKREDESEVTSSQAKNQAPERKFTLPVSTPNFQIGKVNIVVVKQGPLNKTKLMENGKRLRKNWAMAHVVLTDTFLLFFKDQKTFASMQQGNSNVKPEICVDLKGTSVAWCTGDKSKRSNVFEVTSLVLGLTILLQDESLQTSAEWFQEICETIEASSVRDSRTQRQESSSGPRQRSEDQTTRKISDSDARSRKVSESSQVSTLNLPPDKRKSSNTSTASKVSRTKSLKMKILGGSSEELLEAVQSGATSAPIVSAGAQPLASSSGKGNIKEKLLKLFLRRPTMDDLFRRGIIKNEPVFGSTLRDLQIQDESDVPLFVKKCVSEIEKGQLLETDGVYRQSGNLSTIQKIRFQVNQGNLSVLESVDDVHVLTGALKLFFRELKEPLIPWECVDKLLACVSISNKKQKVKQIREVISSGMNTPHRSTLAYLLRHLLKVTELKEFNRMQVPNLAIVFGPTLMWPPPSQIMSTTNLALDMMQQNIIVETLLTNFEHIF